MRKLASILLLGILTLATGCRQASLSTFWDEADLSVSESNYQQCEDRFVRFSIQAVKAHENDAAIAINTLYDRLASDQVAYYVYSDWMKSSFYSILSPCRNSRLFGIAVERIVKDGILDEYYIQRLSSLNKYISLNQKGEKCSLPEGAVRPDGAKTLYLVVDANCPSCIDALKSLDKVKKIDKRVALCFGTDKAPAAAGWDFCFPADMADYFDLESTPFWFVADEDETIIVPYTLAH